MDDHEMYWMPLSRIGVELREKREAKEMQTMWNQIWSLALSVLVYAAFAAVWGDKIVWLVGAIALFIIIYRLNKIY